jgi:hypothetical protein
MKVFGLPVRHLIVSRANRRRVAVAADRSPCRYAFLETRDFPTGLFGPVLLAQGLVRRIAALSDFNPLLERWYDLRIEEPASNFTDPSLFVMFPFRSYSLLAVLDDLLVGDVCLAN